MWWLWDVVKMGDGGRGGRRQRRTMPGILRLGRREEVSSVDNSAHKPTKRRKGRVKNWPLCLVENPNQFCNVM
jgi:hypothetical protein